MMAMATPRPGKAVRGSTTGRPIMVALDLLGRRWTLRILWELRDGPLGFREPQARWDGRSSRVRRTRVGELVEHRLLEQGDSYSLTAIGYELGDAIAPLSRWSE